MFEKILVPLDGSEAAERALPYALDLAQAHRGEIHLLGVCFCPLNGDDESRCHVHTAAIDVEMSAQSDYLAHLQQGLEEKGIRTLVHSREGDPADQIMDTAEAQDCDVIVLTSHGKTGFTHFFLGDIAERVTRQASCPVLIVGRPKGLGPDRSQATEEEDVLQVLGPW